MSIEVTVPTLGESVTEATVATWFKKPGDPVAVDEMLCELETDKVTVEVPSPAAGKLAEILVPEGGTVGVGAVLATIETGAGAKKAPAAPAEAEPDAPAGKAPAPRAEAGAAASGAAGDGEAGGTVEVPVPALGESVTEATVASWFKKPGDAVAADEILCELETDKVTVEARSPAAGTLAEILVPEGGTVQAGGRLALIRTGAAAAKDAPAAAADAPDGEGGAEAAPARGQPRRDVEHAPSARVLMAEKGLSPDQVQGTGRDGRIMKEDVLKAAAQPPSQPEAQPARTPRAPVPAEDAAREERVRMTRLRQTIARRLKDAQNTAAILTTYNEADMSAIIALRNEYKDIFEKKHGVKLGFMSFFVKACCHALKEVPEVNAEIDGEDIVYKNYYHIGVAVGTPQGLVVPVVRDADQLSFAAIEKRISELGARGRDGKLTLAEMQGGTFTISNGGVYGSLMSSPILNPPQSGILGMHKIQERPVVVGGQIVIRPMMYLALSYDHRIVDGKGAVTFLVRVKESLEDPRRLLMDL
ncbi:MAG: 2-oxoglutarate dehydrogenase complex dihydrolipoyllysine-residue succinyltransferase [Alphaproteobacteria bacterium]|nr:MAG: 2-oxoglutarate dehydrogenase complex dihydrolipoyllysine-residue succinyltransferase [Alphaproteobacteria bacterium]